MVFSRCPDKVETKGITGNGNASRVRKGDKAAAGPVK